LGFRLADLAEARLVPDTDAFDASLRASKGKKSKKQD
jgi:hypothetical protein